MTKVINLNSFRKARNKSEKKIVVARNRLRHGRGKFDRQRDKTAGEQRSSELDGHFLGSSDLDDN